MLVVVSMSAAVAGSLDVASRRIAATDHLTGLPNRFALEPRISELAHQAAATGERVAVVAIDVDHLKAVNDEHGHVTGDAVLLEVARRLRECLAPFDSIYRFGGEEFVALLAGYDIASARAVAERMRDAVRAAPIDGLAVTVSIGVAVPSLGERLRLRRHVRARRRGAVRRQGTPGVTRVRIDTASGATGVRRAGRRGAPAPGRSASRRRRPAGHARRRRRRAGRSWRPPATPTRAAG